MTNLIVPVARRHDCPTVRIFTFHSATNDLLLTPHDSFKHKRLAELATPHMTAIAGISQGFAALADIIIVVSMSFALQPSRNPKMRMQVRSLTHLFATRLIPIQTRGMV